MGQQTILWLDDIRNPQDGVWNEWMTQQGINPDNYDIVWVMDYNGFTSHIQENGLPDVVCFDHDLGRDVVTQKVANGMSRRQAQIQRRETLDGYDCAKWMVQYCIDHDEYVPEWYIQSANPVGADNIRSYINSFTRNYRR